MKTLIRSRSELAAAGRWDIDFHLEPEEIKKFPKQLLARIDSVADIATEKRDPSKDPDSVFQYIDIASVDVSNGTVSTPQDLTGEEAPSRARKVVRAFDIVVSTCRPTRGAIAVVPASLHNQIASTGFSVLRPKPGVNPYYLHYALRLSSTSEQFRKWSTGSSYPAILDEDVKKTLIPLPSAEIQERIALRIMQAFSAREEALRTANSQWTNALDELTEAVAKETPIAGKLAATVSSTPVTTKDIQALIDSLPDLTFEERGRQRLAPHDLTLDIFEGEEAAMRAA